jgi:hypothetical protein
MNVKIIRSGIETCSAAEKERSLVHFGGVVGLRIGPKPYADQLSIPGLKWDAARARPDPFRAIRHL